jgi:hypothetical protein
MGFNDSRRPTSGKLVDQLADELKSNRQAGQPFIYEQQFSTGKVRVLVVWDEWKDLTLEERTSTIVAAYEKAEEKDFRARIALASGLTVPEATAAGMLPYHVFPALRKSDPVTSQECREAMLTEGATVLIGPGLAQLRFATEEQADASVKRLVEKLPKSADIWVVTKEIAIPDFGPGDELAAGGSL